MLIELEGFLKRGQIFKLYYYIWIFKDPEYLKNLLKSPSPVIANYYKISCKVERIYIGSNDVYYICRRWNEKIQSIVSREFLIKHSEIEPKLKRKF